MATIKEIAALCGTSRGTVDRVLNGRGHVAPQVAKKVLDAVDELGYRPNRAGKILAGRKRSFRLAFILCDNNGKNPFYADVRRGIAKKAGELAEYGVAVEVYSCAADGYAMQMQIMEECVAKGCDGIALTPVNHPEVAVKLRGLGERGIPVVTVNSDMEYSGRIAYVGSNYRRAGETAAGLMALLTGGRARVGVVSGFPDVLCHTERVDAFCAHAAKHYPGIQVAGLCENNDDDQLSFEKTWQMLEQQPDIDALYLAAAGVQGAAQAVDKRGLAGRVKIVCFDTVPQTVEMMERGIIAAAICQQPRYQGGKPLSLLYDYLAFGLEPELYHYCATEIRIRENCAEE